MKAASHLTRFNMYLNGKKVKREPKKKNQRVFFTTPKQYQQILSETAREDRKGKRIIEMANEIYEKSKVKIKRS